MKPYRHYLVCVTAALLLGLVHICDAQARDGRDHDRARQAVAAGEVMPLRAILERVEKEHPGKVMEVELEREGDRWIYEIKLLRSGGALVKLKFDGSDGTLLGSKARRAARGNDDRTRGEKP
jgi:uncharacterized membrane protein YkoI